MGNKERTINNHDHFYSLQIVLTRSKYKHIKKLFDVGANPAPILSAQEEPPSIYE